MQLHSPTLFAIVCLLGLLLGGLKIWLWTQDRKMRALATIGAAFLLGATGSVLLAGRGKVPDLVSIDLANAMIAVGYGMLWSGMRQFEKRPIRPWLAAGGAIAWEVACLVPPIYDSFIARVVVMSLITATYCLGAAFELLRGSESRGLPSRCPLVALLGINGLLHLCRAPLLAVLPVEELRFQLPLGTAWFVFVSVSSIVVVVGISILFLALAKEHAQRREVQALAAMRDASLHASEEKSRFLARMSHELRTLLNSVLGMAQLMARDPALDPDNRHRAATLERAGRHLVAIVNDALDLARVEAGRLALSVQPVVLRDLLEDALDLAGPAAVSKRIRFTRSVAPELPAVVMLDPVRVRQILLNLLGNAVKFSPPGGHVVLAAEAGAGRLMLTVTDNGPGIPPEQRSRLFLDYERMGADQAGLEGTGLGLAITAALAEAMGGLAGYASVAEGTGSRFIISLPLQAAPEDAATQRTAPGDGMRAPLDTPLHILVVDDIAANRMVAEALLHQSGHSVRTCPSGAEAVSRIAEGPLPDAVLMDLHMPQMDGMQATAAIRALPAPACNVPIIAVTAEAAEEEVRACIEAGMDGHVAKPIDRPALLAAIARARRLRR